MAKLRIAIDGPAGSGKSTVSRGLARRLALRHVDTGAMYRALTLKALRHSLPVDDEKAMASLVMDTEITLEDDRVLMDGEDVSAEIRSPEVDATVSVVSAHASVRTELVRQQRELAFNGVVMEGRDIGTVVLADADLKVFLTASPAERAIRRRDDARAGHATRSQEEVRLEIQARDRLDSEREVSPLTPAADAKVIDSTGLSAGEVVEMILELLSQSRST